MAKIYVKMVDEDSTFFDMQGQQSIVRNVPKIVEKTAAVTKAIRDNTLKQISKEEYQRLLPQPVENKKDAPLNTDSVTDEEKETESDDEDEDTPAKKRTTKK